MPPAMPAASFGARQAMPLDAFGAEVGKVEDVLKGLFAPGGDGEARAYREELERTAAAYARLFASADGQTVLEHLCDLTLRRPTFLAHLNMDPMRAYALGCQREGANGLMFVILQAIAMGRSQRPPQREGSTP